MNGYRPVECTIPRVYVAREELPLHRLEWRGRRVDFAVVDAAADGNNEEE